MDPETIDNFITKVRGSIDTLVDQLVEELNQVAEMMDNGDFDGARQKIRAMLTSIEESEEEE